MIAVDTQEGTEQPIKPYSRRGRRDLRQVYIEIPLSDKINEAVDIERRNSGTKKIYKYDIIRKAMEKTYPELFKN